MRSIVPFAALAWLVVVQGCVPTARNSVRSSSPDRRVSSAEVGSAPASATATRLLQGAVLERDAFVLAVLERNRSLEAARQGWRAAQAHARQAGALEDPMLELSVAPLSLADSKAPPGIELGLSQKLPWFGKRAREERAAAAESDSMQSDVAALRLELASTAVALYGRYVIAARALEINAQHQELLSQLRAAALARVESGHASALDALQAESELVHLEHDALMLAAERDVTRAQMNELLHRAPESPLPPAPREPPATDDEPDSGEAGALTRQALARRPEIAGALERARAEQERSERAQLEYYPDLTLSTSYSSMWEMAPQRWLLGIGLNLPIQLGRRAALAEEARARSEQFMRDAERLSDAARTRVFVALKQLEESRHVLRLFAERLLPLAREQVAAARNGFITSQSPFLVVLEAERNLRALELEQLKALVERDMRRAELELALGRLPGSVQAEGAR